MPHLAAPNGGDARRAWTGCRSHGVIRDVGTASLAWPSCRGGYEVGGLACCAPVGVDSPGLKVVSQVSIGRWAADHAVAGIYGSSRESQSHAMPASSTWMMSWFERAPTRME